MQEKNENYFHKTSYTDLKCIVLKGQGMYIQ